MSIRAFAAITATATLLAGCQDASSPATAPPAEVAARATGAPAPSPIVDLDIGGSSFRFWGYTSTGFDGDRSDPINLVFTGEATPLSIRELLIRLDGNRTAFGMPGSFPFDCTWSDAIGEEQTAYSETQGWVGSVIQLQCGRYENPVRFHMRLFSAGGRTIANAHMDLLIPGTTSHQVMSWELAENLVTVDLVRSGLLAASPSATSQVHEAPFRTIPEIIYNGMPAALKQLVVDPTGSVPAPATASAPMPILTDGRATVLPLAQRVEPSPGLSRQEFTVNFQQVIPKPFCNGGSDYVYVAGPIEFVQEVRVTSSGQFQRRWVATGEPTAMAINPFNGQPLGEPQRATIRDGAKANYAGSSGALAYSSSQRVELAAGGYQQLDALMQAGPHSVTKSTRRERCGD